MAVVTVIDGYTILQKLDEGGMGTVYRAVQESVDREVVIKVLQHEWIKDDEFVKRFWLEAVAAAKLNHPNIVQVYDHGDHGGQPYIVMEYVPGSSVQELLVERQVLAVPQVLEILRQSAQALATAHAAGIVHRDIKPGNLMISPTGQVKLTDFGIAKMFVDTDKAKLTQTDYLIGTLQYMAPELFEGGNASPASDIYSLGITAYHMLNGARPFVERNTLKLITKHLHELPELLHERNALIPEPLSRLVDKMIHKKPTSRFSSCRSLEKNIIRLQELLGIDLEHPESVFTELSILKASSVKSRQCIQTGEKLLPWIAGAVLLALSGVLGWWLSTRMG